MDGIDALGRPRTGNKVIGLVSVGHFTSHFYFLLLPPLFPILRDVYGVGFVELGLAMTAFSAATTLTQAPVGFLVDRCGARGILIAGLVLESSGFILIGLIPVYGFMVALMIVIGLGNAVFHPANYAIMSASVDKDRMGRAFSIHTFAGFLGSAAAPATVIFVTTMTDWRTALVICGAAGLVVAFVFGLNSGVLRYEPASEPPDAAGPGPASRSGLGLLLSLPILMGLLFFVGFSTVNQGVAGLGISALTLARNVTLAEAGTLISGFLFAAPVGVLIGGWLADRTVHHDRLTAVSFIVVGVVLAIIAATELPLGAVAALFAVAGLSFGLVAPSRDMMIRAITPPGETGKVFGFVTTGFSIAGMVAPILFGYILDNMAPSALFWALGLVAFLTVITVLAAGGRRARSGPAPHDR